LTRDETKIEITGIYPPRGHENEHDEKAMCEL